MDTPKAIKLQFMREYGKRDFNEITVKALCAATPVARTTFYSYYGNTDDVKAEIEDALIAGLLAVAERISDGNFRDMDFSVFMDATETYIRAHWSENYAFLVRQPNLRFIRKWKDAIKLNFRRRYPEKQNAPCYDAVAEILASAMLDAYAYWMEHPDSASPEEIKPLIRRVLESLIAAL